MFQDIEHALSWHMVFHPELWDAGEEDEANARESAARAAVRAVEQVLASTNDGALMNAEPRLKVLPGGPRDARLVSLFAAAYAGTDAGVEKGKEMMDVDVELRARRHREAVRGAPAPDADGSQTRRRDFARGGGERLGRLRARACPTERTRKKCW